MVGGYAEWACGVVCFTTRFQIEGLMKYGDITMLQCHTVTDGIWHPHLLIQLTQPTLEDQSMVDYRLFFAVVHVLNTSHYDGKCKKMTQS